MYSAANVMLLTTLTLVNGGYLTGHHPIPAPLAPSTVISGGAIGGGPSNGAFSTSRFSQTVSSPAHVQATISTYHGSYDSPHSQGSQQGSYGSSNIPSVVAFGAYGSGQGRGLGGIQGQSYGEQGNGFSGGQGYNSYSRF